MIVWENANVQVTIKDGEYSIYYKNVELMYSKESLGQVLSDIRFEIYLEDGTSYSFRWKNDKVIP